jgi:hypothetical protein
MSNSHRDGYAVPIAFTTEANQGKHVHSIGSIDSISLSAAYGITDDLTDGVRSPTWRPVLR